MTANAKFLGILQNFLKVWNFGGKFEKPNEWL